MSTEKQVAPGLREQEERVDWRQGNKNAERSGHYRRKAQLQPVGFDDLHRNCAGGRQLWARRDELIDHCGGQEHVTAITRKVIERICFAEYSVDHLDLYLAELGPKIINRRKKTLIPIVAERDALLSTLTRLYQVIGLERRESPAESLSDILNRYERPSESVPTQEETGQP